MTTIRDDQMSTSNQHSAGCDLGYEPDKGRAKRILIEILRVCKGYQIQSTRRLFKAFYFAHLYYAKHYPGYLSDWPIVKMQYGPGVGCGEELLEEMKEEKIIDSFPSDEDGPFPSVLYRLLETTRSSGLELDEIDAIKRAVDFVNSRTPDQLSQLTHDLSRSWNAAKDEGDELNIYIDLIPSAEYDRRSEKMARIATIAKKVWSDRS
jgi:hypothetical protein